MFFYDNNKNILVFIYLLVNKNNYFFVNWFIFSILYKIVILTLIYDPLMDLSNTSWFYFFIFYFYFFCVCVCIVVLLEIHESFLFLYEVSEYDVLYHEKLNENCFRFKKVSFLFKKLESKYIKKQNGKTQFCNGSEKRSNGPIS